MKKTCRIDVTSTRYFHVADKLPSFCFEEEEWEDSEADDYGVNEDFPVKSSSTSTLTAYGLFTREKDGSWRVSYEDSEITGMKGCMTTFCLAPTGMLILLRRGELRTCMAFERGARHLCDYGTENGFPPVVVHTHRLESDLNEAGGRLFVEYSLEIRGTRAEHNELLIEITAR